MGPVKSHQMYLDHGQVKQKEKKTLKYLSLHHGMIEMQNLLVVWLRVDFA